MPAIAPVITLAVAAALMAGEGVQSLVEARASSEAH
jgi:hypothetical protein